jgi:hypothetical protein
MRVGAGFGKIHPVERSSLLGRAVQPVGTGRSPSRTGARRRSHDRSCQPRRPWNRIDMPWPAFKPIQGGISRGRLPRRSVGVGRLQPAAVRASGLGGQGVTRADCESGVDCPLSANGA